MYENRVMSALAVTTLCAVPAAAQIYHESHFITLPGVSYSDPLSSNNVFAAGDIDGDGMNDLIIANPVGTDTGIVHLVSGATLTPIRAYPRPGHPATSRFGDVVSNAGDTNGDGINDLLVRSRALGPGTSDFRVEVFSGDTGEVLWSLEGNTNNYGAAIGGVGDTNGDGYDDISVYDHPITIHSGLDLSALFANFGEAETLIPDGWPIAMGDIDNDGFDDFLVADPADRTNAFNGGPHSGAIRLISSATGEVLHEFLGDLRDQGAEPIAEYGKAAANAGDVDNDGVNDLLISGVILPDFPESRLPKIGFTHVRSGRTGNIIYTYTGSPDPDVAQTSETFGRRLAGIGDVNADGFDDFMIGNPWATGGSARSGSVVIYSGATGEQLRRFQGQLREQFVGWTIGGLGDMNNDGIDDYFVANADTTADGRAMIFLSQLCDLADTNCDGECSPADFNAWVLAFNDQAPSCDQNGDGLCSPSDFNAWILNYIACAD